MMVNNVLEVRGPKMGYGKNSKAATRPYPPFKYLVVAVSS
jgi:hypothetical protein